MHWGGDYGMGFGGGGGIFMILFWVLIILGIVYLVKSLSGRTTDQAQKSESAQDGIAGEGDHGSVVGTMLRPWEKNLAALLCRHLIHPCPQSPVCADASCQYQTPARALMQRAPALDYQSVHYRLLEGAGDVGSGLIRIVGLRHLPDQGIQGKGLESAKAEIESGTIRHGPGKSVASRVPLLGQLSQGRAAWIGQI